MTIWSDLNDLSFSLSFVQVGSWSTRVLDTLSGEETIVLMHGTGGHLEAYSRNLRRLAMSYRVIAYDYPGQGFTSLTDHDLEIPDYVSHLMDLLDTLGLEQVHLCGESLGGWVAAQFAADHPERVGRIVLNTPGGTMARPEVMERIRTLTLAAVEDPTPSNVRTRLEWLMADPSSVTDELVDVRRSVYGRPGFLESMAHVLCLQDPDVRRRNLLTDDTLTSIAAPALVVWTSDDPSGPARAGLEMVDKLSQGEFALIEGAGHWPQWEQQAAYDEVMLSFLQTPRS